MRAFNCRRFRPHLALASCAPWLVCCNAMLGIAEPSDTVVDDVHSPALGAGRDGGNADGPDAVVADGATGGAAQVDIDAGIRLPASPFARANWRMPNEASGGLPNAQAFEVIADGIVKDTVTALEWQREADDQPRSFSDATAFCEGLDLSGGGFRVPSRIELTSLLDLAQASPAIDSQFFPEAQPERFWSSSGYAGGADRAWLVSFSFSTSHVVSDVASEEHLTRCVRSATSAEPNPPAELIAADATVTDPATSLVWQRAADNEKVTVLEAQSRCAALALGGGGFRLPTLKELHTLTAEDHFKPAIDSDLFPDTPLDAFWTQSHVPNFPEYTWTVSFVDGSDVWVAEDASAFVRCVRSI